MATVKLGKYEVEGERKASHNAIEFLAGNKILPQICDAAKVGYSIEKVTSKRGNEYSKVVGKTADDKVRVSMLRQRVKASLYAHYGEQNEEGVVLNRDVAALGKSKTIPKALLARIELDFEDKKTTSKKTTSKKTTKGGSSRRKAVEVEVEDTSTGEKYTLDECADMAALKGVSLEVFVKFLKLEGHTVVAK